MLLTVEQAAQQLGTPVRFIRRLRTQKRLAFVKIGSHLRIDSTDLVAYIHAHRQEAADDIEQVDIGSAVRSAEPSGPVRAGYGHQGAIAPVASGTSR